MRLERPLTSGKIQSFSFRDVGFAWICNNNSSNHDFSRFLTSCSNTHAFDCLYPKSPITSFCSLLYFPWDCF